MRTLKYLCIAAGLLAGFTACDEVSDIKDLSDFNVTADKTIITATDSVVNFTFEGNPDYLVFFSGEKGHKYINRNRGKIVVSSAVLNFSSAVNYGLYDNGVSVPRSVKIMLSTDFSGTYTVEEVEKATWTDLSSAFTWPPAKSAFIPTLSGNMDLREYIDKQFYIAFYYYEENNGVQSFNTWALPQFNIDVESEIDGHIAVATIDNAGYTFVKKSGSVTYNPGAYRLQGGSASTNTNEAWLVTRKMDATSVSPDTGTALKEFTNSRTSFTYSYPHNSMESGSYRATFVARNANINGSKEVIKEIEITIE